MSTQFFLNAFEKYGAAPAIVWNNQTFSYQKFVDLIQDQQNNLKSKAISKGSVVYLQAEFSPNAIAMLFALLSEECIVVLLSRSAKDADEVVKISQSEVTIHIDSADNCKWKRLANHAQHPLYQKLRECHHPGLVLFTSGSTGRKKGIVHDFTRISQKFERPRHKLSTIAFLLFDHIGGIDTLLYVLANGSTLIIPKSLNVDDVCMAVERYQAQVLPVSPTFIRLLLMSGACDTYNLSSLKYITYGTEVMPEEILNQCALKFPGTQILQKYGMTELGTMRSRSKSSDSVWVKVGGEQYQTRIVDGVLHVKADVAMLGYLNEPSPFTDDGWLNTGDMVVQDGEYIRFLGRQSEVINVGGEKVYPTEVENAILRMDEVEDVTVYGEKNAILGQMVCATVQIKSGVEFKSFKSKMKEYLSDKLEQYKIPVRIVQMDAPSISERFKKIRTQAQ